MTVDHAAREAKAKRREAALARAQRERDQKRALAATSGSTPQSNTKRQPGAKSVPFSNKKLVNVVLWNNKRKAPAQTGRQNSQMQYLVNRVSNGGELELDDEKLVAVGEQAEVKQVKGTYEQREGNNRTVGRMLADGHDGDGESDQAEHQEATDDSETA